MASKRNPSDPAGPSARQPKKPQTIELDATEVTADPAGASSSAASSDTPPPGVSSPSSKGEGIAWLPSGGSRSVVGPAAAGAAGMLLILALLWYSGFIGNGSNGSGALSSRLSAIEAQLRERTDRPAPSRNDSKALEDLAARLDRVEKTTFAPQSPLSDPALANRLTSAENATKAFADQIGSLNRRADDQANVVLELRNRVEAVQPIDKSEIEAMTNRIAALEKSAGTMESEIGKRATITSDRAVRLALATSALRAAVERGEPFAGELAAARPLASDNAFAALEPFAASGVPSNLALARELSALVPALRSAANSMPAEGGFFERMKNSASRLIRIRPADETSGDDPAAVITRIELKAASADVPGALADLAKLPAAVQTPAQTWIEKAQARIAAVQTSRQLAADAIGALGKATP